MILVFSASIRKGHSKMADKSSIFETILVNSYCIVFDFSCPPKRKVPGSNPGKCAKNPRKTLSFSGGVFSLLFLISDHIITGL